jgi:hypothetical protein
MGRRKQNGLLVTTPPYLSATLKDQYYVRHHCACPIIVKRLGSTVTHVLPDWPVGPPWSVPFHFNAFFSPPSWVSASYLRKTHLQFAGMYRIPACGPPSLFVSICIFDAKIRLLATRAMHPSLHSRRHRHRLPTWRTRTMETRWASSG